MPKSARITIGAVALLALIWAARVPAAEVPDRKPALVVLLVVDQFRADYVDSFQRQWSGGLRRLLDGGAWFRQAEYPYFNTVTCAGHSTIATGTLPSTHGMVMNGWWDRASRAEMPCTQDRSAVPLSYGRAVTTVGDSAGNLRASTLSDELRAQLGTPGRVVSFSLKARSAIPLGGHHPSAVTWFDDSGTWVTSTAFSTTPVREVADYVRQNPVERDYGKTWNRLLPLGSYLFESPAVGVTAPRWMTAGFPHALNGASSSPDRAFYDQWQSSPFADDYLGSMALDVATRMHLGQTATTTDMLAVSFSSLDKVGHDYGPASHEIQDVLARLDRTLDRLFAGLDRLVGPDNYVVVLTADHGVSPIPERAIAQGLDAGRVPEESLVHAIDDSLKRALGEGPHVAKIMNSDVYLETGVFERMLATPGAVSSMRHALEAMPAVARVFTRDQMVENRFDDDPTGGRVARSFDRERSGDIVVLLKPYWLTDGTGTGHGTPYRFDTRVPLLLMGKGIAPGEYLAAASPADIAPTLAFLTGITLSQSEGRVLVEALATASPRPAAARAPGRESARR